MTRKAQEESPAQCHLCSSSSKESSACQPEARAGPSLPLHMHVLTAHFLSYVIQKTSWHVWSSSWRLQVALMDRPVLEPVCSSHILIWKLLSSNRRRAKWKDARKTNVGVNFHGLIFLFPFRHNGGTCPTAQQHHRLHHWCDPHSVCGGSNVLHLPEGAVPAHEGRWGNHDQRLRGARASPGAPGLRAPPKLSVRLSAWWVNPNPCPWHPTAVLEDAVHLCTGNVCSRCSSWKLWEARTAKACCHPSAQ